MKNEAAPTKEELVARVAELIAANTKLVSDLEQAKASPEGRKSQVLKILQTGHVTVASIAARIGISDRNVSSQMTYLRKDGYAIATDSLGRKFIEDAPAVAAPEVKAEAGTVHEKPAEAKTILRKAVNQ